MRDRLRDLLRGDLIRRATRDKMKRAFAEVADPRHEEQLGEIRQLRDELAQLREAIDKTSSDQTQGTQRVLDWLFGFEIRTRRDIVYAADQVASREASELVHEHMLTAERFAHPHRTLEYALSLAPTGGLALEFGVYSGTTLQIIAKARGERQVYGFDSFEGLPEAWRTGFDAGHFSTDSLPQVSGAELVVGWFDDVLPGFLEQHPGPVDFLHVDSDLHTSAETVLRLAGPRLRAGSIVVFDEYFNYPGWQEHEYRAWQEYVARTGTEFSYLAYTYDNEQVVIRVDAT